MKLAAPLVLTLGALALGAFALFPTPGVAPSPAPQVAHSAEPATPLPAVISPATPAAPAAPEAAQLALHTLPAEEAAFMSDLRVLGEMDPDLAIERAAEGKARFGDSADAPERRSILIHALARVGRASEARGEAEHMVNECPDSSWVREVERFTGAHRHRNIRLAANGQLEYQ
ncbi:MAG: hypothetical protein WDO69_02940 [Pseudomonadota bacterium]